MVSMPALPIASQVDQSAASANASAGSSTSGAAPANDGGSFQDVLSQQVQRNASTEPPSANQGKAAGASDDGSAATTGTPTPDTASGAPAKVPKATLVDTTNGTGTTSSGESASQVEKLIESSTQAGKQTASETQSGKRAKLDAQSAGAAVPVGTLPVLASVVPQTSAPVQTSSTENAVSAASRAAAALLESAPAGASAARDQQGGDLTDDLSDVAADSPSLATTVTAAVTRLATTTSARGTDAIIQSDTNPVPAAAGVATLPSQFSAALESLAAAASTAAGPAVSGAQAALGAGTAGSASAALASAVGSAQWSGELGGRVLMMVQQNLQSAQLSLNPAHLGPMQVEIRIDSNNQTNIAFSAVQPETRHALEASLPQLRDMLVEGGVNIGNCSVGTGSFAAQDDPARQGASGSSAQAAATGAVAPAAPTSTISRSLQLVDTFA